MAGNLHQYASKTTINLIIGGFLLLFVVGVGLIALFYGLQAALLAFICMLGGLVPIGMVALLMFGLNLFVKKTHKD